ncbi:hypothetical protein WBP06_04090 [Novosphingobium sp. BL-8H]|uniref:hypothetical protein n=1 Tax=Novosphingobium sp. BL-8H TaxID=3127640 RepID=UPI0037565AA4
MWPPGLFFRQDKFSADAELRRPHSVSELDWLANIISVMSLLDNSDATMPEKLFSLFRKECERLEQAILAVEGAGKEARSEIRRLEALHRAVNDQIQFWARDFEELRPPFLKRAA